LTTNASNAATDIGSKLQIAPILTCILCSLLF
jgi:hypothetical protein